MALARFSLPRRGVYAQAMLPALPVADILAGQFYPRDFRRYDILIRARVARAWLSDESDVAAAQDSYEAMQSARGAEVNLPRFRALVESVASEGVNPDFPIGVSPWGPLLDGAHRLALALVVGTPTVSVDVRPSPIPPDYSRAWLASAGLPDADLHAADVLLDKYLATTGHDHIIVIAGQMTEEIRRQLGPGADVVTVREAHLTEETVVGVERALTSVPWHEHHKRASVPPPVLQPGLHQVVRLRLSRPSWHRLPKTHTRVSGLAQIISEQLRAGGVDALVGLTWAHNRNAVAVLEEAGVRVWGPGHAG
jgi:hypothetical protein